MTRLYCGRLAALFLLVLAVACGDSGDGPVGGGSDNGGNGSGAGTTGGGPSGGGDEGGAGGAGGGGGGEATLAVCALKCAAPTDCATPSVAFDEDNWDCVDELCVFLGCQSDTECQEAFMNGAYACSPAPGSSLPTCHVACSSPNECVVPGGGTLYDLDNWGCESTFCVHEGCNSTAECEDSLMGDNYECGALPGAETDTCVTTCAAPADCVVAAGGALYDVDNWACENTQCIYLGCKGDLECQQALGNPDYVCRM